MINKCDNCSLCKPVCPVFRAELKETVSPRGLLTLIKESIFSKELYQCTTCGACQIECPYEIDIKKEILSAREKVPKTPEMEIIRQNIIEKGSPYFKKD